MHYRSVADLNDTIMRNYHRLPRDIDLIVGIPRSGMLAANLLSLLANIPMSDLDRFVEGKTLTYGVTKKWVGLNTEAGDWRRILVVDDSIDSGRAMREARARIEASQEAHRNVIYSAVYGAHDKHDGVDFIFEVLPHPRVFQWNFLHHRFIERSCVDIDGVLCVDPTNEQNDDGAEYERFVSEAIPLLRITQKIGYLVTSRLEKYRSQTEAWLKANGINYGQLIMLDLPSAEERRRLAAHGRFKAEFYKNSDCILFIESERQQAETIAKLSGKPVLCIETQHLFVPDRLSLPYAGQSLRTVIRRTQRARQVGIYGSLLKLAVRHSLGDRLLRSLRGHVRS
jgi:uncharacterized HAD superfamily protein/hypoxanthine phosphoribosyltransferase